ncbi:methyltransferase family protein [Loktanella sp. M215]|uniref:methyltransferase family protein n=1 Tax=Loktanella sp. M215 TaxID=2675431 RepID=UPI001F3F1CB2|nr:DUF1295 domain-containing protein [Loktanella sp. M215]
MIGLAALAYFLVIAAATKQHFTSETYPIGMVLISTLSLVGLSVFMAHAFLWTLDFPAIVFGMILAASALFAWAIKHSRDCRLSLAFDEDLKIDGIITTGPWRYVRHPFYTSYVLFWSACALGTTHMASVTVCVTLVFIYVYSAIKEEGVLRRSTHGPAYLSYKTRTGFFFPRYRLKP